jgi:NAD(P)-dependent dehydrogenase (short-subunit alcohol dehydrogenase family)
LTTSGEVPLRRLEGRVAVVTGASSGHGRAIALRLSAEGASVVCADRRKSALPAGFEPDRDVDTDDLIASRGGQSAFVEADVTSPDAVERAGQTAVDRFGSLDIWVNNAGIFLGKSIGETSFMDEDDEMIKRTLDVNLMGTWYGCRTAVRLMRARNAGAPRGRIVNISSVAADMGESANVIYNVSKAGVWMLTRNVALECAADDITANTVAPGYFPTAMNRETWDQVEIRESTAALHALPLGEPRDVAAAVAFLASDDASFVTGVFLPVDGGLLAK